MRPLQKGILLQKGVPSGTLEIGAQGGVHELITDYAPWVRVFFNNKHSTVHNEIVVL